MVPEIVNCSNVMPENESRPPELNGKKSGRKILNTSENIEEMRFSKSGKKRLPFCPKFLY